MTRRDFILKWLLYALALLPVLLLQLYIFPRLPIFGIIPALFPLAAATVAVLEGPTGGAGFGLFVGILSDALIPGIPGTMTLALTLLGICAGTAARYGIHQNIIGCLICSSGALVVINGLRVIYSLLRGRAPLLELLVVAIPEIIISLIFLPVIYGIFLWVFHRVPKATVL